MPGINWGQLQPIQPPSVVAQLPQQQSAQQGLGDLAGGIMSGIQQGQAIQGNQMKLDQQRQQMSDEAQIRSAKSGDQYINILQSQGRFKDAEEYKTEQMRFQNAVLQNKSTWLDLNDKERAKADRDLSINVGVMGHVMQLPPEQQQQAYQQIKNDMKKQYPSIVMPDEFSESTAASVITTANIIKSTQDTKSESDVASLEQWESQIDKLNQEKQRLIKMNAPTDRIDERINNIKSAIKKKYGESDSYQPNELEKDQKRRDELKAKIDSGTATESDKQNYKELTGKINKSTKATLYDKVSGAVDTATDAVGNAVSGVKDIFNSYSSSGQPSLEEIQAELARRKKSGK